MFKRDLTWARLIAGWHFLWKFPVLPWKIWCHSLTLIIHSIYYCILFKCAHPGLFFFIFTFSVLYNWQINFCRCRDLNCGSLVSGATVLPSVPQPLYYFIIFFDSRIITPIVDASKTRKLRERDREGEIVCVCGCLVFVCVCVCVWVCVCVCGRDLCEWEREREEERERAKAKNKKLNGQKINLFCLISVISKLFNLPFPSRTKNRKLLQPCYFFQLSVDEDPLKVRFRSPDSGFWIRIRIRIATSTDTFFTPYYANFSPLVSNPLLQPSLFLSSFFISASWQQTTLKGSLSWSKDSNPGNLSRVPPVWTTRSQPWCEL